MTPPPADLRQAVETAGLTLELINTPNCATMGRAALASDVILTWGYDGTIAGEYDPKGPTENSLHWLTTLRARS